MKDFFRTFGVALSLAWLIPAPAAGDAGRQVAFEMELLNVSPYRLSPGGIVVHNSKFKLFEFGAPAPPAVSTLCTTGDTADFVYYTRSIPGVRNSFPFHGGAAAHDIRTGIIIASTAFSKVTVLSKVLFTDDTCIGAMSIELFDDRGEPKTVTVDLVTLDAGVRENLRRDPPESKWISSLGLSSLKHKDTRPPDPVRLSNLLGEKMVAKLVIRPKVPIKLPSRPPGRETLEIKE